MCSIFGPFLIHLSHGWASTSAKDSVSSFRGCRLCEYTCDPEGLIGRLHSLLSVLWTPHQSG